MRGHPQPQLLHAWADDALEADEHTSIASHISHCPACQATVDEARGLDALFAATPTPVVPADLAHDIVRAVIAEQHILGADRRPIPMRTLAAAFAAVAMATVLLLLPVVGVGLKSWLLWAGLSIKEVVMLGWELFPVAKALVLLAQQIYIPLLIATALTAALPLLLAGRLMGFYRPQLRGA